MVCVLSFVFDARSVYLLFITITKCPLFFFLCHLSCCPRPTNMHIFNIIYGILLHGGPMRSPLAPASLLTALIIALVVFPFRNLIWMSLLFFIFSVLVELCIDWHFLLRIVALLHFYTTSAFTYHSLSITECFLD